MASMLPLIALFVIGIAPSIRGANLLHLYAFQGNVNDTVGGANGTPIGNAVPSGGKLMLDGSSYVQFATHLVPTSGSYSVALFAQETSPSAAVEFLSQGSSDGPGFYIGYFTDDNAALTIRGTDAWQTTGVPFPTDGKQHHYALVVDATINQSRLYVDGILRATLGFAISTTTAGNNTRFGRQFDACCTEYLTGNIADVRIYSGALTDQEVAVLAGPVEWPLSQGGNGHFYQLVNQSFLFWPDARAQAAAMGGYLATITSADENAWILQNMLPPSPTGTSPWLGAADFALNGQWTWVEGPEAGQVFWNNGVTLTYANWGTVNDPGSTNEPNNCCAGPEFWLAINRISGKWMDLFAAPEPFLVEYPNPLLFQPTDQTTGTQPVTLEFSAVSQPGTTTLVTSTTGPTSPTDFSLGTPATYYSLSTTTAFTGLVTVCINYSGTNFSDPSNLQLFHFENGDWMNITTSLDPTTQTICGTTATFSPFVILEAPKATIQPPINADGTSVFKANRGVVPVKFTLAVKGVQTCQLPEATILLTRISGGVLGPVNENAFIQNSDTGSNFRAEAGTCQYVYNLGTASLGAGTYKVQIRIKTAAVGSGTFGLQ